MGNDIMTFGDFETEKHKFHQHKNPTSIYDVGINKIVLSSNYLFGRISYKYFIANKHAKKVRRLCITLPQMSAYRRDFGGTKYRSLLIKKNIDLLEKYNEIWNKYSNSIKKGFPNEPECNEKHVKTKIKSYKKNHDKFLWR